MVEKTQPAPNYMCPSLFPILAHVPHSQSHRYFPNQEAWEFAVLLDSTLCLVAQIWSPSSSVAHWPVGHVLYLDSLFHDLCECP